MILFDFHNEAISRDFSNFTGCNCGMLLCNHKLTATVADPLHMTRLLHQPVWTERWTLLFHPVAVTYSGLRFNSVLLLY